LVDGLTWGYAQCLLAGRAALTDKWIVGDFNMAVRHINPFKQAAGEYRKANWFGTLPIPYRAKHPPPTGYTGHRADYPDPAKLKEWCEGTKRQNICLRLAGIDKEKKFEVIGIDVDHYMSGNKNKKGGDQLAELEAKLGPLPDTWTSTARADGISGIRYYRVPRGLAFRGQIAKDIECIQKGHRFAVVWPSLHPDGLTYWWFPPGVLPTEGGKTAWNEGEIPDATKLPMLPDRWLDYLTQGRMEADATQRIDMDATVDEIYQWADDTFHGEAETPMCALLAGKIEVAKKKIREDATSHDKIVMAHMNIFHLASEGHLGWNEAVNQIESFWAEDVIKRDKRGLDEVTQEVWRSRTNGLRKIKAQIDERVRIGAAAVDRQCDLPGGPCCTTVDAGSDPGDPLGDIPRGAIKPVGDYTLNDDGNAEHLLDMFSSIQIGPSVRYAEGHGWIVWHTGTQTSQPRWERDQEGNQEIRNMFWKVRDRQEDYVTTALYPDMVTKTNAYLMNPQGPNLKTDMEVAKAKYKEWKKFSEISGNNRQAENAIKAARSFPGVTIDVNCLDQNPYLLGVANGVVELDGEDVRKRLAAPDDYITLNTGVPWEEPSGLAKDVWQDYLETFVPETELQKSLQVVLGHCLIGGNPEKVMVVFWGPPNTGKSTLITAIQTALGDYCQTVNQSLFQNHKLNPVLADALSKRVIVCSEFDEHDQLSASVIKRMTGGHDEVRAEKKNSNAVIVGIPQFVMILATNDVPHIPGPDKALENRLYPIPFNTTPQQIKKETANQIKAICGPVVLDWLIEGYIEYRRIGGLPMPVAVMKAKKNFISQLDEIATFANDMVQEAVEPTEYVSRKIMYNTFERWWIENKYQESQKPNMKLFTRRLSALGYESPETQMRMAGTRDRFWIGVKLRTSGVIHRMPVVGDLQVQKGNNDSS
jgi:P4 family phage/plasmid primase-like protien